MIPGLIDSDAARDSNLQFLEEARKRLKNKRNIEGEAQHFLVRHAITVFRDNEKYKEFRLEHGRRHLVGLVEASLFGDDVVSQSELGEIIREGEKYGLTESATRRFVENEVVKRHGQIETPSGRKTPTEPDPPRPNPPKQDELSPVVSANIATGIAASLAVIYIILERGGLYVGGWFGWLEMILFVAPAIVSISNASHGAKRHGWSLVAAFILYFENYHTLLILLPVFALWHWSPFVFSRVQRKPNLVWILPLVLCVLVYGSVGAVQRIPKQKSFIGPAPEHNGNEANKREEQETYLNAKRDLRPVDYLTRYPRGPHAAEMRSMADSIQSALAMANDKRMKEEQALKTKHEEQQRQLVQQQTHPQPAQQAAQTNMAETGETTLSYTFTRDSLALDIFATEPSKNTGVEVGKGDSLDLAVTSSTEIVWQDGQAPVGPTGTPFLADSLIDGYAFLCPEAPCGAIVAKISDTGKWFYVGKRYVGQSNLDGQLYVAVNDRQGQFADNFGVFTVQLIHVTRTAIDERHTDPKTMSSNNEERSISQPPKSVLVGPGRIFAEISNIDDRAKIYLAEKTIAEGQYGKGPGGIAVGNRPGHTEKIDIGNYLHRGQNSLRFEVWNKSVCCGVSGTFRIYDGNQLLIEKKFSRKDSSEGVKYNETVTIRVN